MSRPPPPSRRATKPTIPPHRPGGAFEHNVCPMATKLGRIYTLIPKLQAIQQPQQKPSQTTSTKPPFFEAYIILKPRDIEDQSSSGDGNNTVLDWDLTLQDSSLDPQYIVWSAVSGQDSVQEQSRSDTGRGGLLLFCIASEEARDSILAAIRQCMDEVKTQQRGGTVTSLDWAALSLTKVVKSVKSHWPSMTKFGELTVFDDTGVLKRVLQGTPPVPNAPEMTVAKYLLQGYTLVDQNFLTLNFLRFMEKDPPCSLSFSYKTPIPPEITFMWDAPSAELHLTSELSRILRVPGALVLVCGNRFSKADQVDSKTLSYNVGDLQCKLMVVWCDDGRDGWQAQDVYVSFASGRAAVLKGIHKWYDAGTAQGGILVGYGYPDALFERLMNTSVISTEFEWAMDSIKALAHHRLLLDPDATSPLTVEWAKNFAEFLERALQVDITVLHKGASQQKAVWAHLNSQYGFLVDDHYLELKRQWVPSIAPTPQQARAAEEGWERGMRVTNMILGRKAAALK